MISTGPANSKGSTGPSEGPPGASEKPRRGKGGRPPLVVLVPALLVVAAMALPLASKLRARSPSRSNRHSTPMGTPAALPMAII